MNPALKDGSEKLISNCYWASQPQFTRYSDHAIFSDTIRHISIYYVDSYAI